jgi:homoserine kinase type II
MLASACLASEPSLQEAANAFFPGRSFSFSPTSGGVNNVVVYLLVDGTEKYVLRVYNNSQNTARVRFEHAVLRWLEDNERLSFQLPVALPAPDGTPFVTLQSGAEAALFRLIPGRLPKMACTRAIGRASGELCAAMSRVDVGSLRSPTAPYWDLYAVHRSVTRENFAAACAGPAFDGVRESTDFLLAALQRCEAQVASYKAAGLPEQLVHGDLHYDNVLVEDGVVTGLLDFVRSPSSQDPVRMLTLALGVLRDGF